MCVRVRVLASVSERECVRVFRTSLHKKENLKMDPAPPTYNLIVNKNSFGEVLGICDASVS